MSDARLVALRVLRTLETEEAFVQAALAAEAHRSKLDPRDRGLALTLVQGVMRWRLRLDHALAPKVSRGWDQTEPVIQDILRMAAYQLLMLDRIPEYAAVDGAVKLAKWAVGPSAGGFVNGVLRSLMRVPPTWPEGDDPASMSIQTSHPEWRIAGWIERYGVAETRAIAAAHNAPAPLTIRASSGTREALAERLRAECATVVETAISSTGLKLSDLAAPFASESFTDGAWFAQDESSQLVVELLDPQPGERIWEACAAPGGKARAILMAIGETGRLVATDAHAKKAKRMSRLLRSADVRQHDATLPLGETFDRVLVDAPCTGLGVVRRHPEIKWRRTPADVFEKAKLQRAILNASASSVKPGGVLVYSVCSDTRAEGPDVLADFLSAHEDFQVETPEAPRWAPVLVDGFMQTRPDKHDADAFFAVRLRRTSE